jgi:hypothetical protein
VALFISPLQGIEPMKHDRVTIATIDDVSLLALGLIRNLESYNAYAGFGELVSTGKLWEFRNDVIGCQIALLRRSLDSIETQLGIVPITR